MVSIPSSPSTPPSVSPAPPSEYRVSGSTFCLWPPRGLKLKLEAKPAPVPGGTIDLGPFNRALGYQTPICWLCSRRKPEPDHSQGTSAPRFLACPEKGSRLTFWHLPTNNSHVALKGLFINIPTPRRKTRIHWQEESTSGEAAHTAPTAYLFYPNTATLPRQKPHHYLITTIASLWLSTRTVQWLVCEIILIALKRKISRVVVIHNFNPST